MAVAKHPGLVEEEVWPERIASFTKYKEKTYGITRISYYQKEENE